MLEQVDDSYRIGRVPSIDDFHFGRDIGDLRMEVNLALLTQLQKRQRDETFCDRSDAEHRVRSDIAIRRQIGVADAARKNNAVLCDQSEPAARRVSTREHVRDRGL